MDLKESAKDALKVNRKTFVNPRAWLGYDALRDQTTMLVSIIKNFFVSRKPQRKETYEEAMQRLKLTDAEIQQTGSTYYRFTFIFLGLMALVLGAGFFFLIVEKSFLGFLLSLGVSTFLLAQAFQNHFWYFQIKHRKLGCTFEEWRNGKPN